MIYWSLFILVGILYERLLKYDIFWFLLFKSFSGSESQQIHRQRMIKEENVNINVFFTPRIKIPMIITDPEETLSS